MIAENQYRKIFVFYRNGLQVKANAKNDYFCATKQQNND